MRIKTATKLAFWAAAVGVAFSLYQRISLTLSISSADMPWYYSVLVFLSGFNWIYLGLGFLFSALLRPRAGRKDAVPLIIFSITETVFSAFAVLPYIFISSYGELAGNQPLAWFRIFWALTVLVFAAVYTAKHKGWAVRGTALLAGLAAMVHLVLLVSAYQLNWVLLVNLATITLVAQWFWLLFLQGAASLKQ